MVTGTVGGVVGFDLGLPTLIEKYLVMLRL